MFDLGVGGHFSPIRGIFFLSLFRRVLLGGVAGLVKTLYRLVRQRRLVPSNDRFHMPPLTGYVILSKARTTLALREALTLRLFTRSLISALMLSVF